MLHSHPYRLGRTSLDIEVWNVPLRDEASKRHQKLGIAPFLKNPSCVHETGVISKFQEVAMHQTYILHL